MLVVSHYKPAVAYELSTMRGALCVGGRGLTACLLLILSEGLCGAYGAPAGEHTEQIPPDPDELMQPPSLGAEQPPGLGAEQPPSPRGEPPAGPRDERSAGPGRAAPAVSPAALQHKPCIVANIDVQRGFDINRVSRPILIYRAHTALSIYMV